MTLKFEIQPAANPTPEKERAAKLADPGFGRIFTDHMRLYQSTGNLAFYRTVPLRMTA